MRKQFPDKVEEGRVLHGSYGTRHGVPYGAFEIMGPCGAKLAIIATDGKHPSGHGWEHVSVSTNRRTPNWQEMAFVKDLFWDEEETVVQFHPPKSQYVNNHPHCLHLWKPPHEVQLPPHGLVGILTQPA